MAAGPVTEPRPDPATIFVQAAPGDARAWTELAREVERLGLGGLYAADHPGTTASPFVALAAAAAVTDRITLGTCVVNAGLWHPVDLASAVATLDIVSSGRALLGLGAGHTPAEWTVRGRTPPSGDDRVDRLWEVARATTALLDGGETTFGGDHVTLENARLDPALVPARHVPLMIGGNGRRVLELAAGLADIVGITGLGRTLADGHRHEVDWAPERIDETLTRIGEVATLAGREPAIEALVQRIEITDDAEHVAVEMAEVIDGASAEDLLAAPYMWIGTVEEVRAEMVDHRDRKHVTRWVVRDSSLGAVKEILGRS